MGFDMIWYDNNDNNDNNHTLLSYHHHHHPIIISPPYHHHIITTSPQLKMAWRALKHSALIITVSGVSIRTAGRARHSSFLPFINVSLWRGLRARWIGDARLWPAWCLRHVWWWSCGCRRFWAVERRWWGAGRAWRGPTWRSWPSECPPAATTPVESWAGTPSCKAGRCSSAKTPKQKKTAGCSLSAACTRSPAQWSAWTPAAPSTRKCPRSSELNGCMLGVGLEFAIKLQCSIIWYWGGVGFAIKLQCSIIWYMVLCCILVCY